MCGIFGAIIREKDSTELLHGAFDKALELITHRGPDARGTYFNGNVFLGHTRLSILDLTDSGNQPRVSSDKKYVLVYNGEIYNFRDLADEYNITNLRSSSDTEVIFQLLKKFGASIIPEFNGMFSLAFYDTENNEVIVSRDRSGIKPLYISVTDFGICFSSEIKTILAFDKTPVDLCFKGLHEWSYYGIALGENTLYGNIRKILPGCTAKISTSKLTTQLAQYWSINSNRRLQTIVRDKNQNNDLPEKVKMALETAVTRQLVSDVPVGVFLSGGIDSSAIAAFANKHYGGTLATYSAGFDFDKGINELPVARKFAKSLGTDHHELHIEGSAIPDILEKLVHHHDQPFSDAANIPLYLMCEQLNGEIKVILQGDGGDELFGGYKRYSTLQNLSKIKLYARIFRIFKPFMRKNSLYYVRERYSNAVLDNDIHRTFARLLTVEDPTDSPAQIFDTHIQEQLTVSDPFQRYRDCQAGLPNHSIAQQMLLTDFQIILPDFFFEKVDKSTMASSVEVRVPFLDNDLVDLCHSLDAEDKIPGGIKKHLLKKALEGTVSNEILYGPKNGFSVPYKHWLKTSLRECFFDNLNTFENQNPSTLNIDHISSMYKQFSNNERDYGFLLWKILNLTIWGNMKSNQNLFG